MQDQNAFLCAEPDCADSIMTKADLSELGTGSLAYVRQVQSSDLRELFPDLPPLEDEVSLWALLNADGTPIVLTDSRDMALANAFEHDLEMVSVH